MLILSLESNDPFFNLAVDEYLLKNTREEFLILGINERSVIIGKHQVAHRETDTRFVTLNNIPVLRRISGGGTVFHDMGNLNFSFISNSDYGRQVDFRKYTRPVISFLSSLGIEAKFEGKNDLRVDGKKISGNAEHVYHERVLHHGTLLFSSDMEMLRASIRKDTRNYLSRAVGSNPSETINLIYVFKYVLKYVERYVDDIHWFKRSMADWFLMNMPGAELWSLTREQIHNIGLLAESRYRTWEWNYAYGPEYTFNNRFEFGDKDCFCSLAVRDGIITECKLEGAPGLEKLAIRLTGCRHMVNDIKEAVMKENYLPSEIDVYKFF